MYIVPLSRLSPLQSIGQTGAVGGIGGKGTAAAGAGSVDAGSFADVFKKAYDDVTQSKAVADADSYNLAMGKADDLPSIMINSLRAATTLETATQLTSRAVSSYKEIMQMQV